VFVEDDEKDDINANSEARLEMSIWFLQLSSPWHMMMTGLDLSMLESCCVNCSLVNDMDVAIADVAVLKFDEVLFCC